MTTNITKITKDEEVIFSSDHKEGGSVLTAVCSPWTIFKDFGRPGTAKDIHELLDRVIS